MPRKVNKRLYLDYGILIPYLVLVITGIIMVLSASSFQLMQAGKNIGLSAFKQSMFLMLSFIAIVIIYKMKTQAFHNRQFIMVTLFIVSLLVLITPIVADPVNGAAGWLSVAGISIQPSEYLRIMIIWYLAYILSRRQNQITENFKEAVKVPMIVSGCLILLVAIQPDLGGAAILTLMTMVVFFASGVNFYYLLVAGGTSITVSFLLIEFVALFGRYIFPNNLSYVYRRFETFVNPFNDALGDGLQMINSYFAISNGGWFGLGIGNSIQKKGFLPEAQNDFIFPIIVEELGLIVALLILGLLVFLIIRIFLVGIRSNDPFNSIMCIGIGGMLLVQMFVNVGGVIGIIPMTGVTFPFISQGGSSLLVLSMGVGFALNISADERRKKYLSQVSALEATYQENKAMLHYH